MDLSLKFENNKGNKEKQDLAFAFVAQPNEVFEAEFYSPSRKEVFFNEFHVSCNSHLELEE